MLLKIKLCYKRLVTIKKIKLLKALTTAKTAFIILLSIFVLGLNFFYWSSGKVNGYIGENFNGDFSGYAFLGLFLVAILAANDKFIADKLKAFEQSKFYKVGFYIVTPVAFVFILFWIIKNLGLLYGLLLGVVGALASSIIVGLSWPLAALYLVFILIKSMFF